MKLTESSLRTIVREELIKEMHFFDKEDLESMKPKSMEDVAVPLVGGAMFTTPLAIATYLQNNPEMMEKVQSFLQSLMEE